jgi:signal transduction histidine kinase
VFLDLYLQRQQIIAQRDELASLTIALQAADQQKNRFLAVLAHELRNPLAVLAAGLNILERRTDQKAIDTSRKSMRQHLSYMTRLVDDLLDINRIERGKISLRRENVLLSDILPSALEIAAQAIEGAGHTLAVDLPEQAIVLDVDPARFVQMVGNIVGNAARYTPHGGQIRVSASRSADKASIVVSDNGVGIPADQQARVFEMFEQSDAGLGVVGDGLGIGLALVKQLVELHGGTIQLVSSTPGEGSTFEIQLPARDG